MRATYIVCTFLDYIFGGFGGKERDDFCYYLLPFYVVSVEFVATLNRIETTLFKINGILNTD